MGNSNFACKRTDIEEDQISKIFKHMFITEQNVTNIYNDFINCIILNNHKIEQIDKPTFDNFINKIVSPFMYWESQVEYFQNLLLINDIYINGIKRIGLILIFLSDGIFMDKINLLEKHIIKYYGKTDKNFKEFISDLIVLNTDMCLLSFKKYIDKEYYLNLSQIWKKQRKQKLIKKLTHIYDEMKNSITPHEEKVISHLHKFLIASYNNLTGDSIRTYLNDQYIIENNIK